MDFTIRVCYDPTAQPPYQYTDEGGNDAQAKQHCHKEDKIKWVIDPNCNGVSNLAIHFGSNNPFVPSTPDPAPVIFHTFNDNHQATYKYTVSLNYGGQPVEPDDPQIMFDD